MNKLLKSFFALTFVLIFSLTVNAQFGMHKDLVKLKTLKSFDNVYTGGEFKLAVIADIDSTWHINSNKPNEDFLIPSEITIESNDGFNLKKVVYPKANELKLGFSDKPLSVWEEEAVIGGLVEVPVNLKPGDYSFVVTLNYQACNNQTCLPPTLVQDTVQLKVVDRQTPVSETNQAVFSKIDLGYTGAAAAATSDDDSSISSTLESSGLLLGLLFVFIGGLALNLTPCVYPLIPITIGYFGGQSEGNTKKLVLMGLLFVMGMSITYSVIGVVTSLSGAVFGSLLQNTYVILFVVLIFIVLSLSMFGVYEFRLPTSLMAKAGGAKSGMFGAFFMGLTMGIVAAPCIGPFVLGLVTYVAAKGDPFYGFLIFFVLAMGLGTPYLFLAIFSGKIKKLPRAGEWMDAVKHIFGFVLLGMAAYFALPLLPKSIAGYVLPIFMLIAAVYILFFDKLANNIKGFRIFKVVFSIILIGVAVYSLIPSERNSINWSHYNEEALTASLSSNKAVIIDFYADWCIPCKELEAMTFSDPNIIKESSRFAAFKADMTKSLAPEVEKLRNKYKIVGVPTVLIIDSKGNEVKRITGFVPANEFLKDLKRVD